MLKNVFAALFIAVSVVHLYACYFRYTGLRRATKPLLMPLLLLCYAAGAAYVSPVIVAALALGTLGDALLLSMSLKCFTIGAAAFAAGHAAYIWYMAGYLAASAYPKRQAAICVITVFFVYAAWTAVAFAALRRKMPPRLRPLLPLYMLLIGAMSACAVALAALPVINGSPATIYAILAAVGSFMFVMSDSILVFETFGERLKRTRHSNFFVMMTYIAAQALLVWGLAGLDYVVR